MATREMESQTEGETLEPQLPKKRKSDIFCFCLFQHILEISRFFLANTPDLHGLGEGLSSDFFTVR